MTFSRTWSVDKYKSDYESEEHWQLRKNFMETHKNKYTEDKLVCLARVFFNVEFLGCKYPDKTMKLIADLSKGVADEHREKQKGKLKRTFVGASDAAEAKVKRLGASAPLESQNKVPKPSSGNQSNNSLYSCFVHADIVKPETQTLPGDFPGLIVFVNCNYLGQVETCPINILTQSVQKSSQWKVIQFEFPVEKNNKNNTERYCEIKICNKLLSSGTGISNKDAKLKAAAEGLDILRKTNYTIQAKSKFFSEKPVIGKDEVDVKECEKPLPQDNIGSKIMQRMGWTGSGLGKAKQGIQEPVKASSQIVNRAGLGCINQRDFYGKFRQVFKDYVASDNDFDLVFAPDFSNEERKTLHQLAQKLNLKTQSYGKDDKRFLVVYKVIPLPVVLNLLLACGGENDKYLLIPPSGDNEESSAEEVQGR